MVIRSRTALVLFSTVPWSVSSFCQVLQVKGYGGSRSFTVTANEDKSSSKSDKQQTRTDRLVERAREASQAASQAASRAASRVSSHFGLDHNDVDSNTRMMVDVIDMSDRMGSSEASTTTSHTEQTSAAQASSASSYRIPTPPTGIPLSRIFSNTFPLPFSEAYEQWSKRHDLESAETDVLSFLPFYPVSDGVRKAESIQVDVGNGQFLNEFQISRPHDAASEGNNHLLVLHGYGAGLAFFYRNFEAISRVPGWTVHALDLLGYGRSSRPKFKISAKDPREKIIETEAFFIDSLEKWRIQRGIDKLTIVAHSLGGYLAAAYATKYRDIVRELMLVSPAGVSHNTFAIRNDSPEAAANPDSKRIPSTSVEIPLWFNFLWEQHVSPFSLVRNTGPLGPRFVSGWTNRRFSNLPQHEAEALHRYSYNIFNAPGSGEYALNYLLAPGAHARWPLAERAHLIPCPTDWIYGESDWMDIQGGIDSCNSIREHGGDSRLMTVAGAGHHIYLDNPRAFNGLVVNMMSRLS